MLKKLDDRDAMVRVLAANAVLRAQPFHPNRAPWKPLARYQSGAFKPALINKETTRAIEVLVQGLKEPNVEVRRSSASYLMELCTYARLAVPALIEALTDKDAEVRDTIALGFCEVDFDDPRIVRALIKAVKSDKNQDVRRHAVCALREFGPKASSAVPVLIEVLGERDEGLQAEAAGALEQIGPPAKAALPALKKALQKEWESEEGKQIVREAIRKIEGRSPTDSRGKE